jgi:hypothetical protein
MSENLRQKKILFSTHEIGGQMQLMVEELRRRGYYATAASYTQEWYGHVNDIDFNLNQIQSKARQHTLILLFTLWAAQNYDIFHFFWGSSLYGIRGFPHLDLPWLRRMGKKIFVHFRGTDIIDQAYFDYLHTKMAGIVSLEPAVSRFSQLHSLAIWRRYAHKILVSWPGLLNIIPEAILIPQAVDLGYWKSEHPYQQNTKEGIIRIAHAPSRRRTKGTEFVEQSIAELKAMDLPIELVMIEKVPFDQVKALYETADICVDQMLAGWYGKVSIEMMALGKPVLCNLDPHWLPFSQDLPIVNAHPGNLTEKLKEMVQDTQLRRTLGQAGQDYVRRTHDVKVIMDQCLQLYQESFSP